jgi:hypothetical protein
MTADAQCQFCNMTTGGQHEAHCPMYKPVTFTLIGKTPSVSASNVCASLSDSLVFPTLAFGSIMPLIILGQFIAKVAGGALWMLILKKKNVVQLNQV